MTNARASAAIDRAAVSACWAGNATVLDREVSRVTGRVDAINASDLAKLIYADKAASVAVAGSLADHMVCV